MENFLGEGHEANWVLLSFLIFAAIAYKFGRKAILAKLDGRIDEIRKEIETAESLRVEAQEMLAQYQRKQRDAIKDAEDIIRNAKVHADKIRKTAEAELEENMKRREQLLTERLKRMEEAAIHEIQAHAADLAISATAQVIASELDKQKNEKLVDESIKSLSNQLN